MSARRLAVVLFAALLSVCGCGTGTRPFLMVQLCLRDAADLKAFVNEVHTAVAAEGLTFIDGSAETAQELKTVGYPNRERADGSPVINIGAEGRDGLGVMAGNTGLPMISALSTSCRSTISTCRSYTTPAAAPKSSASPKPAEKFNRPVRERSQIDLTADGRAPTTHYYPSDTASDPFAATN